MGSLAELLGIAEGEYAAFSVSDTGVGIITPNSTGCFRAFSQLQKTTVENKIDNIMTLFFMFHNLFLFHSINKQT
ncbi:MAG: hypothetical protein QM751_07215 [Paludibacteraceae bacterium]